ncbi:hypothetical protein KCP73_09400 [Salmonella enterica subsp. enterica]|nr:hypothetical protein KCP73_09400 [Salmonella enterica subsp. enterica]
MTSLARRRHGQKRFDSNFAGAKSPFGRSCTKFAVPAEPASTTVDAIRRHVHISGLTPPSVASYKTCA